jgi:hypothetical protein
MYRYLLMNSKRIERSLRTVLGRTGYSNRDIGSILFFAHNLLIGGLIIYAILGPINRFYWVSVVVLCALLPLHFYFNGCILIRLERYFWNDYNWKGLWTYLFGALAQMGIDITPAFENNTYIVLASSIMLVIFIRLVL